MTRSSAPRGIEAQTQTAVAKTKLLRCAIYTRKSTEEGLQQEFNSLDAQREAAEAFILSQRSEGWRVVKDHFDDGGYTGGNMDRPALQRLLKAAQEHAIDCVVVYKVDRLSRSLLDFARMMEIFERHGVSFVSVTQQFNTTTSLGRLTLNILLSFAQFERELISERTRDKMSAARRKGKWIGGHPVLGYDVDAKAQRLVVNAAEAQQVRALYQMYLDYGSLLPVIQEAARRGFVAKPWTTAAGKQRGGQTLCKATIHGILTNALYTGVVDHKGTLYPGEHEAIVDQETWERVQAGLRRNKADSGASVRNKYGALLRGLVYCTACGTAMAHTYTTRGARRYRYYVCVSAQQKGWDRCETPSVSADAIEAAAVQSIRRLGSDAKLAQAVVREAVEQTARRREALSQEIDAQHRTIRQLGQQLARTVSSDESATKPERIADLQTQLDAAERRIDELANERAQLQSQPVNADDLQHAIAEFDAVWNAMTARDQEELIHLLVGKVGFDGRNGKVTVHFNSEGAKELCQGK